MNYVLGLDGGGTKTAAVILDRAGVEQGRGQGGPCNIATCEDATLTASLHDATRSALQDAGLSPDTRFAAVCAGVAGCTAKHRRADFARLLAAIVPADRHRVEPDFVVAYWGATEGEPGIVVIAGTGAVVYGRNAAGEARRVDGRGFLLGDRGSGFEIGRLALRSALRNLEHRRVWREDETGFHAPTEAEKDFDRRLLAAIGAEDADDLIEWVYRDFQPARIAELAKVVGAMADEGNETASMLIQEAGYALRSSVTLALQCLQMPVDTPIYTLGGLWNVGDTLRQAFEHGSPRLIQPPVSLNVRAPKHDPAFGAALLALREETPWADALEIVPAQPQDAAAGRSTGSGDPGRGGAMASLAWNQPVAARRPAPTAPAPVGSAKRDPAFPGRAPNLSIARAPAPRC